MSKNLQAKTDLKNLTQEGLIRFAESLGQSTFRGKQIMGWLYRPGITEFSQMTDLAKVFRHLLEENASISRFADPIIEKAEDGCVKFGFRLDDGHIIESVLIPEPDRNTLCISSQVGCAMGCTFCLTGTMGFIRNLTPCRNSQPGLQCPRLSACPIQRESDRPGPGNQRGLYGHGRTLNNLDNVLASLSIIMEQKGLDISARKITVSTCGIVPKIRDFGEKSPVNLAISLHAVNDTVRSQLMPVNNRYPVDDLLDACRDFPMPKRKRIMFEYIILQGINDADKDAYELARKLTRNSLQNQFNTLQ